MAVMTTLEERYQTFRSAKAEIEASTAIPAQRMLNFLRKVEPTNYVRYRLWGDDKADTLDRFTLQTESEDSLEYVGDDVDERSGKSEYFSVPFSYVENPDVWEQEIKALVKADRKLVREEIKEIFSDRIKKREYELSAFPSEFGETRFMRVVFHCKYANYPYGMIKPTDPVLADIVSGHHEGFVYDRHSGLFYLDGWVKGFSSVAELIEKEPELAKDRIFRGTEVNSTGSKRIR